MKFNKIIKKNISQPELICQTYKPNSWNMDNIIKSKLKKNIKYNFQ
jgi:hypothetical protein